MTGKLEIDCHCLKELAEYLEYRLPKGFLATPIVRDYGIEVRITSPSGREAHTGWTYVALAMMVSFKCVTDHIDWNIKEMQRLEMAAA